MARCLATIALRTSGSAASAEASSVDLGRADRLGDVLAVEQHAVAVEADVRVLDCSLGSAAARYIAPVSRYVEAQRVGDGAGDGGLAGPRGAVDGDAHAIVTIDATLATSLPGGDPSVCHHGPR